MSAVADAAEACEAVGSADEIRRAAFSYFRSINQYDLEGALGHLIPAYAQVRRDILKGEYCRHTHTHTHARARARARTFHLHPIPSTASSAPGEIAQCRRFGVQLEPSEEPPPPVLTDEQSSCLIVRLAVRLPFGVRHGAPRFVMLEFVRSDGAYRMTYTQEIDAAAAAAGLRGRRGAMTRDIDAAAAGRRGGAKPATLSPAAQRPAREPLPPTSGARAPRSVADGPTGGEVRHVMTERVVAADSALAASPAPPPGVGSAGAIDAWRSAWGRLHNEFHDEFIFEWTPPLGGAGGAGGGAGGGAKAGVWSLSARYSSLHALHAALVAAAPAEVARLPAFPPRLPPLLHSPRFLEARGAALARYLTALAARPELVDVHAAGMAALVPPSPRRSAPATPPPHAAAPGPRIGTAPARWVWTEQATDAGPVEPQPSAQPGKPRYPSPSAAWLGPTALLVGVAAALAMGALGLPLP